MSEITGPFIKAKASGQNGNCVEVAPLDNGGRAVRDSKNPTSGTQFYTASEWSAFIAAVKAGEFGL